eukprot:m.82817 g.82817  ORF g.82817 m.82817 type:complete len:117 (+) comp8279_c0_seq2:155-505(+)
MDALSGAAASSSPNDNQVSSTPCDAQQRQDTALQPLWPRAEIGTSLGFTSLASKALAALVCEWSSQTSTTDAVASGINPVDNTGISQLQAAARADRLTAALEMLARFAPVARPTFW